MNIQSFPFHLVQTSPWPLATSLSLLVTTISSVLVFQGLNASALLTLGILSLLSCMALWWKDVIIESTYQGNHTVEVVNGIKIGFILFISTEAFFFLSIFWAYLHSALAPSVELGAMWPPMGIESVNPFGIPLLNTFLLLSSGMCQKYNELFYIFFNFTLPFSLPKVLSTKRIGPHNIDVLSIFMGSMLGDGTMEKDGNGYRFSFYQEKSHGEYLLWLHKTLYNLGYCKKEIPQINTRLNSNTGSLRYYYRFRTFTYSSFEWIYNGFYKKNKKIVPIFINDLLTPLALAVWIMDNGCKFNNKGIKLSTNSFTLKNVKILINILKEKYNLNVSIHKTGVINQYNIYISKSSMPQLNELVKSYIHPTMLYKII